jgi:hypothetical protein
VQHRQPDVTSPALSSASFHPLSPSRRSAPYLVKQCPRRPSTTRSTPLALSDPVCDVSWISWPVVNAPSQILCLGGSDRWRWSARSGRANLACHSSAARHRPGARRAGGDRRQCARPPLRTCEDHAQKLLALQAPVAGELRTILAALYCAEIIERVGDLAAHIAATVRFNHASQPSRPPCAVPSPNWDNAPRTWRHMSAISSPARPPARSPRRIASTTPGCAPLPGIGRRHRQRLVLRRALGDEPGAAGTVLRTLRRPGRVGRPTPRLRHGGCQENGVTRSCWGVSSCLRTGVRRR